MRYKHAAHPDFLSSYLVGVCFQHFALVGFLKEHCPSGWANSLHCNRPFYCCLLSVLVARLEVTLFWYRLHCFCHVNQVVLMLTGLHSHEKSREVCFSVRSIPTSLPFKGQVAEQTTVKWAMGLLSWWLEGGVAIATSVYT